MIGFQGNDKAELNEVLEILAYRILHYEHPTWHSIPEEEVVNLLRAEGLMVDYLED